jgi:hypothetical protein
MQVRVLLDRDLILYFALGLDQPSEVSLGFVRYLLRQ